MNNPLAKLFERKKWKPEKATLQAFKQRFPYARNVEWTSGEVVDEVLFYYKKTEYLARYSKQGEYLLHKVNLHTVHLPAEIDMELKKLGEIMNVIKIFHKDESIQYEIIHRDEELIRFKSMVDQHGKILETSLL
ncbi:MAG: hypothetical protein JJU28_24735 [Cyclobacteriaceae bacterium]|nr:hypothetical protein [Cyclobacteriaceae bacterium]